MKISITGMSISAISEDDKKVAFLSLVLSNDAGLNEISS